jgi:hypothetical protein
MAINDDSQTVSTDAKWLLKRLWRNSCALSAHHCRFERPFPVRSACNQWPYLTAEEVGISGGWRTESESSRDATTDSAQIVVGGANKQMRRHRREGKQSTRSFVRLARVAANYFGSVGGWRSCSFKCRCHSVVRWQLISPDRADGQERRA